MIEAVCFDLDGTLIHYRDDYSAYVQRFAERLGLEGHLEAFRQVYPLELTREGPQNFSDVIARSLAVLGLARPRGLEGFCQEAVAAYAEGVELLPGALGTLEYFSRWPLALVTNGPADMQRAAVEKVGIAGYFKTIMVSADPDVGVRKPNSEIFRITCERLGVEPSRVLMIGDNLLQDVRGAEAAGMQALWIPKN
ncbi:MAG: HAD family hydrolase [Meiothermus sp.]|nr:HAD family hydrolase [Meiothermus sp.]